MSRTSPLVHDLVLIADRGTLTAPDGGALAHAAMRAAAADVPDGCPGAWAVVRRAPAAPGLLAVGLRGAARSERYAACAPADGVVRHLTPDSVPPAPAPGREWLPAFRTLAAFRETAVRLRLGNQWGPGGSVGFELATGRPAVTGHSDLDAVLRAPEPLPRHLVARLLDAGTPYPARLDLCVETPLGAFSAAEWLREGTGGRIVLKTPGGPVLTSAPWGREP